MNRQTRIPVDPAKCVIGLVTAVFFLGYGIYFLTSLLWPEALFFLTIGAAFAVVVYRCGSTVALSRQGVRLCFLMLDRQTLSWAEIREVGIIGENIFNRGSKKTGTKYIYFSPRALTEQERFQLGVRWPPRRMPYIYYSKENIALVQQLWQKGLAMYNVDDLDIYAPPPPAASATGEAGGENSEDPGARE